MSSTNRPRKWWGWGYADEPLDPAFSSRIRQAVQMALGISRFRRLTAPDPAGIGLRSPRFSLPEACRTWCSDQPFDRLSHAYGQSFRDVMRALRGEVPHPPDYVAFPHTEAELSKLMDFCSDHRIALIPYGGGTSVVGGVESVTPADFEGCISVDLKHFDQVLEVDRYSRSARVQAGLLGPALEAQLRPHGLTLRHFPQSFEFSSVGGWIATRAGGHFATVYTHIDEFVAGLRMLTPQGIWQTRRLPGSGAGPDPNRFMLGSEGILGIITEAWLRLQDRPRYLASASVGFPQSKQGIAAVHALSQSGLFPSNCRLVSALEAFSMGLGNGQHTMLLLGFESHDHPLQGWMQRALDMCRQHEGVWEPGQVQYRETGEAADASGSQRWKQSFLQAPYLRDELVQLGLITETFESAITWDRFEAFHQGVKQAVNQALKTHCGKGLLTWRFTHVYPDGPAVYYTVMAPGREGEEVAQWDAIKQAASQAIIELGGTITHHHAVGRDHAAFYQQQQSPLFGEVLKSAKARLDPKGILNPGVLI